MPLCTLPIPFVLRVPFALVFALVFALGVPGGLARAQATADHNLVLALESYIDDATVREEQSLANLQNMQDEDEVGRGPVVGSISLTYLTKLTDIFLVGGGARYLGSYRYQLDDAEQDDEETLLGRLFEVYGRAEFRIPLITDLTLVPGVELGIPLLFASGSLQAELDTLETTGYNVNSLPRVGFLLGGEVGARYQLESWLALRVALGILHEKIFLYDASTDDDLAFRTSAISLVRLRLGLGAEVSF